MYPASPTVQAWRSAAASVAKANGTDVPYWFDGSDASTSRLNSEFPQVMSSVRWFMHDYVLDHRDAFPAAHIEAARAFIAKNPNPGAYAAPYALSKYGLASMAGDFVAEMGKNAVDLATDPAGYVKKNFTGTEAVKKDPRGFLTVALAGIALGGAAWYLFGRRAA